MTHSSSSRQFRSSVCFTLPHFRRLTHFLVLFCLHRLSQSLHELHVENASAFLRGSSMRLLDSVIVEILRLVSMSSFSLVTLLFVSWVCKLLNSPSVICRWESEMFLINSELVLGSTPVGSHTLSSKNRLFSVHESFQRQHHDNFLIPMFARSLSQTNWLWLAMESDTKNAL